MGCTLLRICIPVALARPRAPIHSGQPEIAILERVEASLNHTIAAERIPLGSMCLRSSLMTTMTIHLRSIPGTQAAVNWAEAHTIFVDRPDEISTVSNSIKRGISVQVVANEQASTSFWLCPHG